MELALIFLAIVLVFLGYNFWLRFISQDSFHPILERLRHRIQMALRVAGVKELENIQEKLTRLEQQVQAHMVHSKPAANFLPNIQKDHQKRELSLDRVGRHENLSFPVKMSHLRPRSVERNGLRFTLSDDLWINLGNRSGHNIEDDQLQAMVQGPFCRICLKRLVGRDHTAEIPVQCRHCGTYWNNKEFENSHLSVLDLKRQVYVSLDQEYQQSRRTPG